MGFEPIGFVLDRVYDLLKYEASILLVDEKKEIEGLQRELELIESYLKDMDEVEREANINHVLQTKVQQIMHILPEIENFLDTVTDPKPHPTQPSCSNILTAFFSCTSNPVIVKHRFVEEITQIKENLFDTLHRPEKYQLPKSYPQVTYKRRFSTNSRIIHNEIIIGLEEDVETLVAKFVGKQGKRGANSAIVGMGGSGKTTLAKMFYNHPEIKEAFPIRAWVCVSQVWNPHDLLVKICAMVGVELSKNESLIANVKLQEFLDKNSCLVVLDDVWERDPLQGLIQTLLSGKCRVLITTRYEKNVRFRKIGPFRIQTARLLEPEESWELFYKILCNSCEGIINFKDDVFLKLGREMLEKCDGLPLAIVTLAGLLGTKDTVQQWKSIKDDVKSIIMGGESDEAVKKVLELSYFDLPYHLKPCFLYLGTFEEDAEIDADTLINMWIDEGFVKSDKCQESRRLRGVAKNFLDELVQRCMVQVISRDYAGDVKEIRIHDLMRDLCINKAGELGFFRILSATTTSSNQTGPSYCRAIIHRKSAVMLDNPRIRTLICVSEDPYVGGTEIIPKQLFPFEKLKQVRVLSLQGVQLGDSVSQIGNMVLLRYLRLWLCGITTTAKMDLLRKLRNLQTFIFYGRVKLCDNMFATMEQLRVVFLCLTESQAILTLGVDKLRNLQSLRVEAGEWMGKELHCITLDLRHLEIFGIHSQRQLDSIYDFFNHASILLETLGLVQLEGSGLEFDLQEMKLERCKSLQCLWLEGKIRKQKKAWSLPPKLLSLILNGAEVEEEEDMNQVIAQLNHLRELTLLRNSYKGVRLTMKGLPQLQKLYLLSLSSLKEYRITRGSLPQLQELDITSCVKLQRIPDEISNMESLQVLKVSSMPKRFCKRIEKREEGASDGGEDFHLVQHIPTVTFQHIFDD